MRNFDLSPLYRSTIGFDRLFALMNNTGGCETASHTSYPPYNIEKRGDHLYRITLAVAGFRESEITITSETNTLIVRGDKNAEQAEVEMLFQGIAARQFERRFQLEDYVTITEASLENGLLHIDLKREIPEAKKPRIIPIASASPIATNLSENEEGASLPRYQ